VVSNACSTARRASPQQWQFEINGERTVSLVGRRLKEVLPLLHRKVLDVMVEVGFERRKYRGVAASSTRMLRLVAVLDAETGEYHCYLTNIPPDRLAAEDIARTYALRWQVELLFETMKLHCQLDDLPSSKKHVVECLIWASVLCAVLSQVLMRAIRRRIAADRTVPLLRWAALFSRLAGDIFQLLLSPEPSLARRLIATLMHEAPDPNRNRKDRALAGLVSW